MPEGLTIEPRDGATVLRMQFGRANAFNPGVVNRLTAALDEIEGPTVVTGDGTIFSAGLDLVGLDALDRDGFEEFLDRFSVLMVQVLTARRPVVAAVNGHAVAGGCVLALACDRRVGTRGDFRIGMNELALGLTLPAVAMEIPRAVLTPRAHRQVVLEAELVDPDTAVRRGLLDELADDAAAAVDRAVDAARELGREPQAYASVKGAVVAPVAKALRAGREAADVRFVDVWFSDAARARRREAIRRLREKKD